MHAVSTQPTISLSRQTTNIVETAENFSPKNGSAADILLVFFCILLHVRYFLRSCYFCAQKDEMIKKKGAAFD